MYAWSSSGWSRAVSAPRSDPQDSPIRYTFCTPKRALIIWISSRVSESIQVIDAELSPSLYDFPHPRWSQVTTVKWRSRPPNENLAYGIAGLPGPP